MAGAGETSIVYISYMLITFSPVLQSHFEVLLRARQWYCTAVILTCSVQNFKINAQLKWMLCVNVFMLYYVFVCLLCCDSCISYCGNNFPGRRCLPAVISFNWALLCYRRKHHSFMETPLLLFTSVSCPKAIVHIFRSMKLSWEGLVI